MRNIVLSTVVLLLIGGLFPVSAQPGASYEDTRPQRGFMPYADHLSSEMDSIDVVSGSLKLAIPLASLPRGRAGMGFDVDLVYDSQIYDISDQQTIVPSITTGGWHYSFKNYRLESEPRPRGSGNCNDVQEQRVERLRISLADGSMHVLHLQGYGDELGDNYWGDGYYGIDINGNRSICARIFGAPRYPADLRRRLTYFTSDGSFLKFEIDATGADWESKEWTLYFPDGRRLVGQKFDGKRLYDANGNFVEFANFYDANFGLYTEIRDSLGRKITVSYDSPTQDTIIAMGPNGTVTWTVKRRYLSIDGPLYNCGDPNAQCNGGGNHLVIDDIFLPSTPETSYHFTYAETANQDWGELSGMKTPIGAQYSYTYANPYRTIGFLLDNPIVKKTVIHDGMTDEWTFEHPPSRVLTRITNPDQGQFVHRFNDPKDPQNWARGLVWQVEGPLGSVRTRTWARNIPFGLHGQYNKNAANPFISQEQVTAGGSSPKTAITNFVPDKNGNLLFRTEYDWTPGPIRRVTAQTYYQSAPNYADTTNSSSGYWQPHTNPAAGRRTDAIRCREISDDVKIVAATAFEYDDAFIQGNVKVERRWDDAKPGAQTYPGCSQVFASNSYSQVLTRNYDGYGNLTDVYEPEVRTHITYDSNALYPVQVDYAPDTIATRRIYTYTWNFAAGVALSKTDADNNIATTYMYDPIGRRTRVEEAGMRRTETAYDDIARTVSVKRDLFNLGQGELQSIARYDQLGRVVLVQTSDGSPLGSSSDGIKIETKYKRDALSQDRLVVTSTPYRQVSDSTLEWTCTKYDKLDRVASVSMFKGITSPDNTNCQASADRTGITETVYDADRIGITDATGRARNQYHDGLGRLTRVTEDPGGLGYVTDYQYDSLDNLLRVTQSPQPRTFLYSSLGRLLSASNPESGTTLYTYKDSGDLDTREDARHFKVTMTYDGLHRVRTKTYSGDGGRTPAVTYEYYPSGSPAPNVGRLKFVSSSAAKTTYSDYDALGRFRTHTQDSIPGNPNAYTFNYAYWLNDELASVRYPSGRSIDYSVDGAGRVTKVSTGTKIYADLPLVLQEKPYTADGRIAWMKFGNDLWETREYRTPGTATTFKLGTSKGDGSKLQLDYNYHATQNNGNLLSHVIQQPGRIWTQTYDYDNVNRLTSASESGGWTETQGYDRFGNRWLTSPQGPGGVDIHEPTSGGLFNPANNRINGLAYDDVGNLKQYDPRTLDYDAENRIVSITSTSNGNGSFVYDGDGRRVKKVWTPSGGTPTTTYYIYDATGHVAAEYSDQGSAPAGTSYIFTDMLGSVRAVTGDKPTSGAASILECYDYLPFGRLLRASDNQRDTGCYTTDPIYNLTSRLPQKFTGKERDAEIGLDWWSSRYSSAAQGRFTSPDPIGHGGATQEDPQSWNQYAYARNNPLLYTDPDGFTYRICDVDGNCENDYRDLAFNKNFQRNDNIRLRGGSIYEKLRDAKGKVTGERLIGTYQQTDVDLTSPLFSAVAQGVNAASPVADPRFIAGFYAASALGGLALYEAGAFAGGEIITLNIGGAATGTGSTGGSVIGAGLRRQIDLHRQKLADYIKNPDAFDNKGFLKNASPELRQKIIESRIRNLQGQIREFTQQLEKLIGKK